MRGSPSAQLRGNNTQAKLGAERLSLRVIVPVSASERLQLFVMLRLANNAQYKQANNRNENE